MHIAYLIAQIISPSQRISQEFILKGYTVCNDAQEMSKLLLQTKDILYFTELSATHSEEESITKTSFRCPDMAKKARKPFHFE